MLDNYNSSLKRQVHTDLTLRARGGIAMYLAIWLITAFWAEILQTSPVFFYLNTLLFALVAAMRITHYLVNQKNPHVSIDSMSRWLILLILASSFHWGLLSAWIIYVSGYQELHYPYMTIIAAFAIGGTSILSISKEIRIFYPIFMLSPSLILGLFVGGTENLIMVALAIFALIYVLEASRVSSKDYWEAISNHQFADERAQIMEHLSNTDQLTSLKNRMYFNRQFDEEWKRCNRQQNPLGIMMIDLDHFKKINDTYGHVFGDECLKKVAATLTKEFPRTTDTIARYGGEEFVALLPNTDLTKLKVVADKLVRSISQIEFIFEGKAVSISCSIGLATTTPDHLVNNETLLVAADKALYQAKEMGRNQWREAMDIQIPQEA